MVAGSQAPFVLRAPVVTPLAAGGTRFLEDAATAVDSAGRIASVDDWTEEAGRDGTEVVDLRPLVLLPGLVDLHAHLPQLPMAGLGAGLDLLTWLQRCIFPLERSFDVGTAARLAPAAFRAFAAAGTTTVVLYGAVYAGSVNATFEAAEAHGIRAVIGKVMMDRVRYDEVLPDHAVLDTSLREATDLCARWHLRDGGLLRYAFTPRFAVACSAAMLRGSADLAAETGAYWQTHLAEDADEIAEVARLHPDAADYTDVYDRAGGLGDRTILAHAIHLSDREVARLRDTHTRVAHCPESNLFLGAGVMPLAKYLEAGLVVGLGSDVAGGPDVSIFRQMRVAAQAQAALRALAGESRPPLGPLELLRLGTIDGARALGLDDIVGSVEPGKDADLIAVDVSLTSPVPGADPAGPADIVGRLIQRTHPDMVRRAWVRGRPVELAAVRPPAGGVAAGVAA